jgi:hypothetical protein
MSNFDSRVWRSVACAACFLVCRFCVGQQSPPAPSEPTQTSPAQSSPAQSSPVQNPAAQSSPAQTSPAPLPNAPTPSSVQSGEEQPKRIMGVMPNFRSVSAGQVVPEETFREKLVTSTEDNFDYTSLFFAGWIAADSFVTKATPEFHQGAAGFARYYWHSVADQSIENYFVELIVPTITHEDSRYYAMGKGGGGFWKRTGYSLSRVLVTRTDSGKETFNYSEITGSAAAASVSNFYYPTKEQTVGNGLRNWGLDITYDSVTFMFHEFWPDISNSVFGKRNHAVVANP